MVFEIKNYVFSYTGEDVATIQAAYDAALVVVAADSGEVTGETTVVQPTKTVVTLLYQKTAF